MSSKKRKYTFGSGCENIPSKELCNQAGEYNGMGCAWKGGRCESVENFVSPEPVDPCSVHDKPMTCDGMFNLSGDCEWGARGCRTKHNIAICEANGRHHYDVDHCGLLPAMIIPNGVDPRDPNTLAAKMASEVCQSFYANPAIGTAHVCRFDQKQAPKEMSKDGVRGRFWMCSNGQRCNPPTGENFTQTQAQTHDGESCKGGMCVRWWRAK